MPNEYTPSQTAAQIGVSVNTVRRWCKQFADHLSDEANARPRQLTDQDLAVLEYVAACRADGMPWGDIDQRLGETTLSVGEIVVPEPSQEATEEQLPPEGIQAPALLLQAHTDALQRLTARLEQQHSAEVKVIAGEVATLRTWLLVLAAIVLVLIVGMVALWVMP